MSTELRHSVRRLTLALLLVALWTSAAAAQARQPVVYTVRFPAPAAHVADVEAVIPTGGKPSIDLMMPVWSPGFYRVENYATNVHDVAAHAADGTTLAVEEPQPNRWRVQTGGRPSIVLTYAVTCERAFVTADWVGEDMAVLNGAPTFITLVEHAKRPHDVRLELAPQWPQAMTSLDPAPDRAPNHFRAADYDELVDSPIVAGRLSVHEFSVAGKPHYLVDAGDVDGFDGARAAHDLQRIVQETVRFWGFLPYKRYVFLNLFRRGGGGLEHLNSTMLTSNAARLETPKGYLGWLGFVSHEYFHAFNVKRLRPVELGPFDYEHPPSTSSLWISEGLTSYFGELIVTRSGLGTPADFLAALSGHVRELQNSPGRLVQTLDQASLAVWNQGNSGVGQDPKTTVSYYVKGPVVGFLLDARIRRATGGSKGLDDAMRLAYKRYAGARGFTPGEFQKTAEAVAGADLTAFFTRALASTEELDYTEALDWFGLRFASSDDPKTAWTLEVRPDATAAQRSHLAALTG